MYATNYKCKNLASIIIPNSVTTISRNTFSRCTGLTTVSIGGFVTSIGDNAFSSCSSLNSVVIPTSVTNIGNGAFSGCDNIRNIHSNGLTPPNITNISAFDGISKANTTIYVPIGSKEDYKYALGWKDFINIIEENIVDPIAGIEKPTITLKDNALHFDSHNEGAEYLYSIDVADAVSTLKAATNGIVPLTGTYKVTAYAKTDKGTSEAAIATFDLPLTTKVEEVEVIVYDDTHTDVTLPTGEVVRIEIKNGIVYLSNLPLNSAVYVYTEGGELWESRRVTETTLSLQLPRQTVYVIKASGKTFKVKL